MGTTQNVPKKISRANVNCNKNTLLISQTMNWLPYVFFVFRALSTVQRQQNGEKPGDESHKKNNMAEDAY